MLNAAMKRSIDAGDAFDLSKYERLGPYYVIPEGVSIEDKDLCDARGEVWIWSAGVVERDQVLPQFASIVPAGTHVASTATDLYQCEGVQCTFLR